MMNTKLKVGNVPNLRFPGFVGEWDFINGNEVFDNISNKDHNSDLPILAITQEYGAIPRELIDYKISVTDKSVEGYKIVEKGDFIISLRSFQGGIEYSEYKGICSPAYLILRPKVKVIDIFFKYYLKTSRYITSLNKNLEGIRDGKMISYKYFSEIALSFPTIKEQNKIASFLSLIDKKILSQNKIIEELETLIKGAYQEIFDNKKSEFSCTPLKLLASINKGKQINASELSADGIYYVMNGGILPSGYHSEYNTEANTISISEGGNSCGYVQYNDTKFWSGGHCYTLSKISTSIINKYLYHYLKANEVKIMALRVGSGLPNIQKTTFENFEIKFPNLLEQKKIIALLDVLSNKLFIDKQLLNTYQQKKKYFLQNIFA